MSSVIPPLQQTPTTLPAPPAGTPFRADVVVENKIAIPGWVNTLEDYRRWAVSDEYPRNGWVSYLNGKIWVDPEMEEFLSHNRVKQAFNFMFGGFFAADPMGCFVPDRMLLVNTIAGLSTEPDGLFYLWPTMQNNRLRMVPAKNVGCVELEGTPDGVLEIVSDGSVTKDFVHLRELYWKAQVPEYWLVDARKDPIQFDILRHGKDEYKPSETVQGWVRSGVLGHWFRIEKSNDPLGLAQYTVQTKP